MYESAPEIRPAKEIQGEWEQAFDRDFWPLYPRRVAKYAAKQAWGRIFSRRMDYGGHEELLGQIVAGLEWYLDSEWRGRPSEKIPHATTWLNQRRWEDAFDEA